MDSEYSRTLKEGYDALRRMFAKVLYDPNFDEEKAKVEYLGRKRKEEEEYNQERVLFANRYFGYPDYVPGCCMDGLECLAYCSEDDQKKFEKAWEDHWDDYLDKKEYESLRQSVDPEKYRDFLEKRVNNRVVGVEFDILYYGDYDQGWYWDLAEWEGYVEILYTTWDSVRIKILKHYKEE